MTAALIYAALAIALVAAVYFLSRAFDGRLGRIDLDFSDPCCDADRTPIGDAALRDVLARRRTLADDEWAAAEDGAG